jgi:DNA polymerase-3 subunit delta'
VLILLGTSPARQLPTIRSRAQVVRFKPLSTEAVADILLKTGTVAEPDEAVRIARLSDGSLARAVEFAQPELSEFRERLLRQLSSDSTDYSRLAHSVQAFVDGAGKEAAQRRDRLRSIIRFAMEHYRDVLWPTAGGTGSPRGIDRADRTLASPSATDALAALDACLDALEYIDRNANIALVAQNWCDELAKKPLFR